MIIFSSDSLTIGISSLIYLNYLSSDTETRYWHGYSLIYNCFSHSLMEITSFLCEIVTNSTSKVKICYLVIVNNLRKLCLGGDTHGGVK